MLLSCMHSKLAGMQLEAADVTAVPPHVCRLQLTVRCTLTGGEVGRFRQAYNVVAERTLVRALAEAVQACGLRAGEKSHGLTDEDMETIM